MCYMDKDSFIVYIKIGKERTRKLSAVMKDEFGWKIMKKFIGLKAKTYSYLRDEVMKIKKLKAQKSVL